MKRIYALCFALSFGLFACNSAELEQLRAEKAALEGKVGKYELEDQLVRGEYAETIETLNEIEDSLRAIAVREKEIQKLASSTEFSGNVSQRESIINKLQALKTANENANKQAKSLQAQVRSFRIENAELRKMIAQSESRVLAKERELDDAQGMIDGLRTALTKMESQLLEKSGELATTYEELKRERDRLMQTNERLEKTIAELQRKNQFIDEQAKAYVVCGTRRALRKKDILMDLGRKLARNYHGHVRTHGSPVDFFDNDEINCGGDSEIIDVLPPRSEDSYEIRGNKVIVTDAKKFWATDKTAVLVLK